MQVAAGDNAMMPVPHEYRARPMKAIDGDTIRVLADTGFYGRHQVDVRLLNVAAPELNEAGGPAAAAFVADWFNSRNPVLSWPLLVRTQLTTVYEPTQRMTFARYVGEIFDIDTGDSLNDAARNYLGTP